MSTALWSSACLVIIAVAVLAVRTWLVIRRYAPQIRRIFVERPLFQPPQGSPCSDGEAIEFRTPDGLTLHGSYLPSTGGPAAGLVVFCHEFLGDRWSDADYWQFLRRGGFDVFAFDFRNHGASDSDPNYQPQHWVTDFEVTDLRAALAWLRARTPSRRLPLALYGLSRGGGTAICAAATDPAVRAVVTDGAFPTHLTVLTYMRKWMSLYADHAQLLERLPDWYFAFIRDCVLRGVERQFRCRFPKLERAIGRIAPRPLLMIHGRRDSYIRPDIARRLFAYARPPREFWEVRGAGHNACLQKAGDEYRQRVLGFLRTHLLEPARVSKAAV